MNTAGVGPAPSSARASARALIFAWAAVTVAIGVLLFMVIAAPTLRAWGYPLLSGVLYQAFEPTCHQEASRSFWLSGWPLAVCSRCTAIYSGALLGSLLVPLRGLSAAPLPRTWLVVGVVPAAIDFSLGWLGIIENTFLSRSITGVLLGSVAAFYVLPAVSEALASLGHTKLRQGE